MKKCEMCMHRGVVIVPHRVEDSEEPQTVTVNVCRFNPPTSALFNSPQGPQALTLWPQINPDQDYCGSFAGIDDPTCAPD